MSQEISNFAIGFARGCEKRGMTVEQMHKAAADACEAMPEAAADLHCLLATDKEAAVVRNPGSIGRGAKRVWEGLRGIPDWFASKFRRNLDDLGGPTQKIQEPGAKWNDQGGQPPMDRPVQQLPPGHIPNYHMPDLPDPNAGRLPEELLGPSGILGRKSKELGFDPNKLDLDASDAIIPNERPGFRAGGLDNKDIEKIFNPTKSTNVIRNTFLPTPRVTVESILDEAGSFGATPLQRFTNPAGSTLRGASSGYAGDWLLSEATDGEYDGNYLTMLLGGRGLLRNRLNRLPGRFGRGGINLNRNADWLSSPSQRAIEKTRNYPDFKFSDPKSYLSGTRRVLSTPEEKAFMTAGGLAAANKYRDEKIEPDQMRDERVDKINSFPGKIPDRPTIDALAKQQIQLEWELASMVPGENASPEEIDAYEKKKVELLEWYSTAQDQLIEANPNVDPAVYNDVPSELLEHHWEQLQRRESPSALASPGATSTLPDRIQDELSPDALVPNPDALPPVGLPVDPAALPPDYTGPHRPDPSDGSAAPEDVDYGISGGVKHWWDNLGSKGQVGVVLGALGLLGGPLLASRGRTGLGLGSSTLGGLLLADMMGVFGTPGQYTKQLASGLGMDWDIGSATANDDRKLEDGQPADASQVKADATIADLWKDNTIDKHELAALRARPSLMHDALNLPQEQSIAMLESAAKTDRDFAKDLKALRLPQPVESMEDSIAHRTMIMKVLTGDKDKDIPVDAEIAGVTGGGIVNYFVPQTRKGKGLPQEQAARLYDLAQLVNL